MQLGKIGLGRMGASMVRRLLRGGHACVVHDVHPSAMAGLVKDGAAGAPSLEEIPGTPQGLSAIEQSIFDGVPINVTLLFSREHYLAAAEAYLRGIERRNAAGLSPMVQSVASLLVSRWDAAVTQAISPPFHNRLGSARWRELAAAGARPQRLLWASTATKDPAARDTLYVEALAAPETINTIPEKTLLAFADHGQAGATLPADGGLADAVLEEFRREGVDDEALASQLQRDGVLAFAKSWGGLLARIREKTAGLVPATASVMTAEHPQ